MNDKIVKNQQIESMQKKSKRPNQEKNSALIQTNVEVIKHTTFDSLYLFPLDTFEEKLEL